MTKWWEGTGREELRYDGVGFRMQAGRVCECVGDEVRMEYCTLCVRMLARNQVQAPIAINRW